LGKDLLRLLQKLCRRLGLLQAHQCLGVRLLQSDVRGEGWQGGDVFFDIFKLVFFQPLLDLRCVDFSLAM